LCQPKTKNPHKINILCGFSIYFLTAFAKASAVEVVPTGIEHPSELIDYKYNFLAFLTWPLNWPLKLKLTGKIWYFAHGALKILYHFTTQILNDTFLCQIKFRLK
jgi:hypothetical protein